MKIHVEFSSIAEMVNFGKFIGNDAVQVPPSKASIEREEKFKQAFERTEANLNRAYQRLNEMYNNPKIKKILDEIKLVEMEKEHKKRMKKRDRDEAEGIDLLPMTVRLMNCMKAEGIYYIPELLKFSASELMKVPNFGKVCLKELRSLLAERNLKLKGD
jgi:DNA-directed RNA polymerase alpha subunit